MIDQRNAVPNRVTTSIDSQFASCTKLAYRTETLVYTHQKSLQGGMANNLNPDHDPILEGGGGGNPVGWITAGGTAILAADAIRGEIAAVYDWAAEKIDDFGDTYSRAWDKLRH